MVSVSVRRNPREPVGRNAQPRNRVYPHPENPGLIEQVDGYYDWAGRRLFLEDGSPDPATPGTYRYQTRPDLCDLAAPDSDPASPRYEPPHLRHKPGDTWIIDRDRPHDPDDPGSFGSPGWRPDSRTGRHRRDELPDPIPPWEQEPAPERAEEQVPPSAPERQPARPRRQPRFWQEKGEDDRAGGEAAQEEPWRFEKLREDAWDRFVIKSSELAAAHWSDRRALNDRHRRLVAVLLRLFQWVVSVVKGSKENEAPTPVAPSLPVPRQAQPQADRAKQAAEAARSARSQEGSRTAVQEARPLPGAQMAQAIRSVQAARVRLAGVARQAAQADQGAAHWRGQPREERPRPSPLPYIARWERAFDAHRAFGEVVVL